MASIPIYNVEVGEENAMIKQMESTSRVIGFTRLATIVLSFTVCVLLLVVLLISINFPSERKLISGTVLGVLIVLFNVAMFVVRADPNLTIVFMCMQMFVSGIGFGVSIQYI